MVFTITTNRMDVTARVEKTERVWKQWVVCLIAYFPFFTRALQSTYLSLYPEEDIPKTQNGVPWTTTGYILGTLISAPVFCWISDKWGRKVAAFLITTFQAISCIVIISEINTTTLITSNTITGIATAGIFTVLPIYVKEITSNRIREVSVCMMMLMTSCGYLVMKLLVMFLEDMVLMYLVMALVIVQFLMIFGLIETASYLVMNGQEELSKLILSKFKGLEINSPSVLKEVTNLKDERDKASSDGKCSAFKILKNTIYRDATKIGIVLHTCYIFGGKLVFLNHDKVLQGSGITLEKVVSDLAVPCLMVGGSLVAIVFLAFWEQKYLLTISFSIMALSLGVLGVFMQADMRAPDLPWIPIAAHAVLVFGYSVGWGVPYLLMVEVLNMEIRATVIGALYTYAQILHLIHVHTFQYVEETVGMYTMCYVFAIVNMFGAVYAVFGVPETRNRSVKQIEKTLKRIPIWKLL